MGKGNEFKNEFKAQNADKKASGQPKQGWLASIRDDERYRKIGGLIFLGLATILILAFTSFLFSWQADHSLVRNLDWNTFKQANPEMAQNWMGILGAYLAHLFIYRWFGVAAYLFILMLALAGVRLLFQYDFLPFRKTLNGAIFFIVWLSVLLGVIFQDFLSFLGGGFGYVAQNWLQGVMGLPGTIIILIVSLLIYLVVSFNMSLWPNFIQDLKAFFTFSPANANADSSHDDQTEAERSDSSDTATPSMSEGPDKDFTTSEEEAENQGDENPETEEATTIEANGDQQEDELTEGIQLKSDEEENTANQVENEMAGQAEEESQESTSTEEEGNSDELSLEIENPTANEAEPVETEDVEMTYTEYDPTLDLSNYNFPSIDLLNEYEDQNHEVDPQELEERKNLIINTLKNYKIDIDKIKATVGPTVTLYEIIPSPGVRISKIKNLEDDIALSLAALGIRIIAPIPGRGTIGIEVPNSNPQMVSMKSVLASKEFRESTMELPIAFGKTISNEVYMTDLSKMPHILMAGATGQGKSVGLNVMLTSLLYKKHPSQVKFVLVDPKKVELSLFQQIEKHFLAKLPNSEEAIITDTDQVVTSLNSLCTEMDNRYDLLKDAQVRNLAEYNKKFINRKLNPEKGHRYLPYIVLVIDEMADLMMTAGKEAEMPIARLAQLARAIGIHLILATQRPSVNIITGVIKANFPARIAFRVTSKVDSRTILDSGGAEQLIGRGDMLFTSGGDLIRLQSAFLDTEEVEDVTKFIGQQQSYAQPYELPEAKSEDGKDGESVEEVLDNLDPMFEEAAKLIVRHQQGSTSLIQRRLKLGYNRAGRIVDQLEAAGVLGPFEGSKSREVLFDDEYALEQFLNEMNTKK